MNPLTRAYWIAKGVGWDNIPRRVLQMLRVRSGWLQRRFHPTNFSKESFQTEYGNTLEDQQEFWQDRATRFLPFPSPQALRNVADDDIWKKHVTDICEQALAGKYHFFSHWYGRLGWPPDFNLDPVHKIDWPTGDHWLKTAKSGPPRHDIKLVWEPSRFTLAYHLGRQYARTLDDRWAEAFWQMFDTWVEQNPCQLTVAWGCGQEITFRLMALLFGAFATLRSKSASNERLYSLTRFVWQAGKQISTNINYARSQKNNHAISEAVGLWTIGLLFPDLPQAAEWMKQGRHIINKEINRQVYDDGSFVQHSMNYHRVMMDDMIWAIRLGNLSGTPLPDDALDRFRSTVRWLWEMLDLDSGRVPNYGSNDGANVLPLSCSDYLDYRPVIQAAHVLLHDKRCLPEGPWDEKTLWLHGEKSLACSVESPRRDPSFAANDGGYYLMRGANSWAMTRCHTYRDRPSQADMLHVDLWYKGVNILRDAGSYMYYCEEPWKHYFHATASHNTVEIDDADQMTKGPRFLWFHWPSSQTLKFETSKDDRVSYFCGEHYGYTRLPGRIIHRRSICRIEDTWIILDNILGTGDHHIATRWRLCDTGWQQHDNTWSSVVANQRILITVYAPKTFTTSLKQNRHISEMEEWESLYYGEMTHTPSLITIGNAPASTRIVTVITATQPSDAAGAVISDYTEKVDIPIRLTKLEDNNLMMSVEQLSDGKLKYE